MKLTRPLKTALLCAAAILVLIPVRNDAAYPRLLMIHGAPLSRPLVVENPRDIVKVIDGPRDGVDLKGLDRRRYLELALFWGNEWNRYMDEGKPASQLKPQDVTAFGNIPIRGKFYPACNDAPALITLIEVKGSDIYEVWRVSADGLKVLETLGVPVKGDCASPTNKPSNQPL